MLEGIVSAALHAVVASLVVGVVLGAIVFALVRFLALSAAVRHALWTIALVATALVPLATFAVSASRAVDVNTQSRTGAAPAEIGVASATGDRGSRPASGANGARRSSPHEHAGAPPAPAFAPTDLHLNRTLAAGIVAVWALGAAIGFGGLAASILRVRGLKRRSSPLDAALADDLPWLTEGAKTDREIYLRLSYEIETPVAIGFRRPVILIPTDLATANGLGDIETLVMHEHAHLVRYDDWTNLLQRAIERLFWFNPLVWIVGRRIALEREIASDEAVVARTGQAKAYANSLWRLAREMRMPEHAVVAPGALLTRKQISIRIETLLSGRTAIPALGPLAALAIVGAAVLSIVAAASSAPALQLPGPAVVAPSSPEPVAVATPRPRAVRPVVPPAAALRPEPRTIDTIAVHPHTIVPAPDMSAKIRAIVKSERSPAWRIDSEGLGVRINDIVRASLANIPKTLPPLVAQAREEQHAAGKTTDVATLAQILRQCMGCDMSGRNLRGIDLRGANLIGINFADADLRDARLDNATLSGVNLSDAKLDGASLVNARFTGVNIADLSLHGAKMTGLRIVGSSFRDMDLRGLNVRAMLDGCVGCNLSGVNLAGADLHGITLTGANLSDANLQRTNLAGAHLSGTNFQNANLAGVDFTNASLSGCNFAAADLSGVHLDGADLTGANLHLP